MSILLEVLSYVLAGALGFFGFPIFFGWWLSKVHHIPDFKVKVFRLGLRSRMTVRKAPSGMVVFLEDVDPDKETKPE